jgi:phospholipase/carboxylesterase
MGSMKFDTPYIHIFKQGDAAKHPLLLLHGTGGDEHSLLEIAAATAPDRSIISPRGLVNENGNLRFFRRFAEGQLDEDDVRFRSNELATFVTGVMSAYNLTAPIALGYSNGANIALAMLFMQPDILSGTVLLRSMAPFKLMPNVDLNQKPILLLNGAQDQIITPAATNHLVNTLKNSNAKLTSEILPTCHGLSQTDITLTTKFLKEQN